MADPPLPPSEEPPPPDFELCIGQLSGEEITVGCFNSWVVFDVMDHIEAKLGIHTSIQELYVEGDEDPLETTVEALSLVGKTPFLVKRSHDGKYRLLYIDRFSQSCIPTLVFEADKRDVAIAKYHEINLAPATNALWLRCGPETVFSSLEGVKGVEGAEQVEGEAAGAAAGAAAVAASLEQAIDSAKALRILLSKERNPPIDEVVQVRRL
jgi:hypothetical protein